VGLLAKITPSSNVQVGRPLADRIEVAVPSIAAIAARGASHLPAPVRRRALISALARAEGAFNRGDYEAVFALFTNATRYVPPPALSTTPISGRAAILEFWHSIGARFRNSTIENLSLDEAAPERFTRTLRLTHQTEDSEISYVIRQVTKLHHGRVVSQVNEQID